MKLQHYIVILSAVVCHTEGSLGRQPLRGTGLVDKIFTSFTQTNDLLIPLNLDYAFIIVRHGMVVPVHQSYPGDIYFDEKWKKERFTTHGRRMMTKLGRSLATRYKKFIDSVDPGSIYVSTMNTRYGYANADEILAGLFYGMPKPNIHDREDIDKYNLLKSPSTCPAYDGLRTHELQLEQYSDEETNLLKFLRSKFGEITNTESEWYMNSRQRVYNLWEILDFEIKSKRPGPRWYTEGIRTQMRDVVSKYLSDCVVGNPSMAQFVAGRLFQEMFDGYFGNQRKLHIHVTNDFTYLAFKSLLLQNNYKVPEFGDTLMVEVDKDTAVTVHTYWPYQKRSNCKLYLSFFKNNMKMKMEKIRDHFIRQYRFGERFDETEWSRRCDESLSVGSHRGDNYPMYVKAASKEPVQLDSPSHRPPAPFSSDLRSSPNRWGQGVNDPSEEPRAYSWNPSHSEVMKIAHSHSESGTVVSPSPPSKHPRILPQIPIGYPYSDPISSQPATINGLPTSRSSPRLL